MSQGGAEDEAGFFGLAVALRAFLAGPLRGDPSGRALARAADVSPDTIGHWLAGDRLPQHEDKLLAVIRAVAARSKARGIVPDCGAGLLDEGCWRRAYRAEARRRAAVVSTGVQGAQAARALAGQPAGWPTSEVTSPSVLEVDRPTQPERALRGLPRKSPVFTGREADLAKLLALLEPDGPADGQPRIAVVTGLPGVGKTELALQAAHAALENGWFPGGVLFIDMRGYDQKRAMTAQAALDEMLRAVGISADEIPPGDHRSRLFTSVMADKAAAGSPILLVIDNVASAEIAAALIPAVGATLVTSRHAMADLRARRINLDELTEAAAVEMLAGELRESGGTDTRIADQHEDALSIARLCGKLPLALHIVAALLTVDTARPLSSMARDLHDTGTRLDEMSYRDADGERGVRSAFDLSYRQLDAEQARVLRLLPLNVGEEISTEAVAAMAKLDVRTARWRLQELLRAHLIRAGNTYGRNGRWRMHDLIRLYVSGLPPVQPRDVPVSILLLLGYYLDSTSAATRLLEPTATRPADSPFADRGQALEWLDAEYPNLTPYGYVLLVQPEFARTATADLFLRLWRYFELRRYTDDWIRFTTHALNIARALSDRGREGDALTKLSGAFRQARRFDEAVDACRDAIAIQRELGDRLAEGVALNNLAAALLDANRDDETIVPAREAAAIFQETGDRHREGIAVAHLGSALTGTRQYAEGAAAYEKAAGIFREVGDQHGASRVLTNLGNALRHSGRKPEEVIDLHRRSAASMAEAGDRHSEGIALTNLTASLIEARRFDEAIAVARDAASLMRDADDPHGLGGVLVNLGMALLEADRTSEAVEALGEAVTAYHRSGDQDAEAGARIDLGGALEKAGNREAAIAAFRATAEMFHHTANHRGEGQALRRLGHAHWEAKQLEEAITALRSAATVSRAAGDPVGEAKALLSLGTALVPAHVDDAIAAFRDAAELCRQVGSEKLAELASGALQAIEAARHLRDE